MDDITLNTGSGGDSIRALEDTDGKKWPVGVTAFATTVGTPDVPAIVTPTTGLPVRLADGSGYLSTLPVSLASVPSHAVTGPLTDTELRASAVPVSGTFWQATQPVSIAATVTVSGTVDLGATDNAVLDAIAASVASTDTKTPALGQALAAGSVPVVLTAAQLSTLTPPAAITGFATESTLSTLNGKVTAVNTGAVTISTALPAGTNAIGKLAANDGVDIGDVTINNASLAVTGTFWQATQPVSIASAVAVTDNSGSLTVDAPVGTPVFVRLSDGASAITTLPVSLASVPTHAVTQSGTWTVTGTGGTFPVTDSGGSLTVDDGGSSLTVDGTVAATQSGTWSTRLQDGSGNAITSATRGGEQALSVQIVDGSGSQIASFGGGTQYTEGDTDASITGTAMLWEDTGDTLRAVSAAKPLPISDAGGSLTVDNNGTFAVQAAQSGTWNVGTVSTVTSVTQNADVRQATASNLNAQVVGNVAHDAAASGNPVRVAGYGSAAAPSATSADGDVTNVWVDLNGRVQVGDGGSSLTVDGTVAFSNTTIAVTNTGTFAVQVDGAALTSLQLLDDAVATTGSAITTKGFAAVGTDGTNARILKTDTSGELQVDVLTLPAVTIAAAQTLATVTTVGTVTTITNPVTAVGAAAHDAVVSGNPVLMGGYASAAAPSVVATGDAVRAWHHTSGASVVAGYDYSGTSSLPLSVNGSGQLLVAPGATFTVNGTVAATQSGGWLVGGDTASDATDAGNPVKIGAKAETSLSTITLVADGDRTDLYAGVDGVLITRPHCNLEDIVTGVASITDGSSTSVIAAQGSGIKTYITSVTISNSSASNVTVDLRDGTGGSVKWTFPAPANAGVTHSFAVPLPFSGNTAVAADPSASATTITVSICGFKSKV